MNVEKIIVRKTVEPMTKEDAITTAGEYLVESGFVVEDYIAKMLERETVVTTYIGNYLAIPHGTSGTQEMINESGISILQTPEGVDFGNGNTAYLVIGIAGKDGTHMDILSKLAIACSNENTVIEASKLDNREEVIALLLGDNA